MTGQRNAGWSVVLLFFLDGSAHIVQKACYFGFVRVVVFALGNIACKCGNAERMFFVVSDV